LIGSVRVLALLPGTYMNESGRAVAEAVHFYKIALSDVVVFHDEIDLPPGKLRVKVGGGVAGHNGLRSITAHIGNDYRRVRIGVGHPGVKDLVQSYVLSDFAKSDRAWVAALCEVIADNAALLAKGEDASFQNKVHLAMEAKGFFKPDEPDAPPDPKKPTASD
jgi:PTH1 family peptidyl-tRNA hydrolase